MSGTRAFSRSLACNEKRVVRNLPPHRASTHSASRTRPDLWDAPEPRPREHARLAHTRVVRLPGRELLSRRPSPLSVRPRVSWRSRRRLHPRKGTLSRASPPAPLRRATDGVDRRARVSRRLRRRGARDVPVRVLHRDPLRGGRDARARPRRRRAHAARHHRAAGSGVGRAPALRRRRASSRVARFPSRDRRTRLIVAPPEFRDRRAGRVAFERLAEREATTGGARREGCRRRSRRRDRV